MGVTYRRANEGDTYPILTLYQKAATGTPDDAVLLDAKKLRVELGSEEGGVWLVGHNEDQLVLALSIPLDRDNRLAKISRVVVDPDWADSGKILRDAMPLLMKFLADRQIEVVYTTTRTMTLQQQELTREVGFRVLGVFPNVSGADQFHIGGLTAYFFGDTLKERKPRFSLHPIVLPFYEIARRECGMEPLPVFAMPKHANHTFERLPKLERIHAPLFVAHRFQRLKEKKALSVHYYPFQEPNVLLTDPTQRIEIFVRVVPELRFAAVIGERIDLGINPVELYTEISTLLNRSGVTYIEVINDAGDAPGIDAITTAGYLPCAYFPCFKRLGDERRDYVVFARSFERLFAPVGVESGVNPVYLEYLAEYFDLEERIYLERLGGRPSKDSSSGASDK